MAELILAMIIIVVGGGSIFVAFLKLFFIIFRDYKEHNEEED